MNKIDFNIIDEFNETIDDRIDLLINKYNFYYFQGELFICLKLNYVSRERWELWNVDKHIDRISCLTKKSPKHNGYLVTDKSFIRKNLNEDVLLSIISIYENVEIKSNIRSNIYHQYKYIKYDKSIKKIK
jgi:hypothetical protein